MRLLLTTLTLLCVVLSWGTANAKKTIFLVSLENPPQTFTQNGRVLGFSSTICREALRRAGYDTKIQLVPWSRALAMVRMGQADGIIDAAFTPERSAYLLYPHTSIYEERFHAFQRAEDNIRLGRNFSGGQNLRVGTDLDFFYGPHLTPLLRPPLFAKVEQTVGIESNILKLLNGRIDIIIEQNGPLWKTARKLGVADKIKPVLSEQDEKPMLMSSSKTYLAFSRKNISQEFVDRIDRILEQMQNEGFMKRTREAYE